MATPATGSTAAGTVTVVVGNVRIVGADGVARVATVGDKVFVREVIETGANGLIQVQLEGGRFLDLGRDSKLALTPEVLAEAGGGAPVTAAAPVSPADAAAAAKAQAAAEAAKILAGADPTQVTEATAAGGAPAAGGGADGGGGTPVVIDQANSTGEVTSGFPTGPASIGFPEIEPALLPPTEPIISVAVAVDVQVGVGTGQPGPVLIPGGTAIPTAGVTAIDIPELTSDGGSHPVTFLITLSAVSDAPVTITYIIVPVDAEVRDGENLGDYFDGVLSATVTIPAGYIGFTVTLNIVEDASIEPNESFKIVLSDPVGATLLNDTATVTIIDDDEARPDSNIVQEGTANQVVGNVLSNDPVNSDETAVVTNPGPYTTVLGGTLDLHADGSYIYTAPASVDNSAGDPVDTFTYTMATSDGGTSSAVLSITITDDVPNAIDDGNSGTASEGEEGTTTLSGNVLANDIQGADGASVTPVELSGTYGSITIDALGNYEYTLDTSDPDFVALVGGETATEQFTYTLTDADGDSDTAVLTLNIRNDDDGVVITELTPAAQGGDAVVDEDDLLVSRGAGESAGSDADKESTTQAGAFKISAPDGVDDLTVGGHAVITNGVFAATSFTTEMGNTLSITGYNAATGEVSYSYTLNDNEAHANAAGENDRFEDFAVVLTDRDGDSDTDTLSVRIVDDVPAATPDGNLATLSEKPVDVNIGTVSGLLGNDNFGADGAGSPNVSIGTGDKGGTVTINGGNLLYTSNVNVANGQTVTESFTYTITDADGDTAMATFTVTLNDTGVTNVSADTNLLADEDDIAGAGGNPGGVGDDVQMLSGHISYTLGKDAIGSVALSTGATGLKTLSNADVQTTWDSANGKLIGYAGTVTNVVFTITLSNITNTGADYTMVLNQPVKHSESGTEDNTTPFTVNVAVTDADGSTGNTSFTVAIDDDTPVGFDPQSAYITNAIGGPFTGFKLDFDGNIDNNTGADQIGSVTFANIANGQLSGFTSGSLDVKLYLTAGGTVLTGATGADANTGKVFTITLNPDGGAGNDTYSVQMFAPIDNGAGVQFADLSGGDAGNPPFKIVQSTSADNLELLFTPINENTVNSDVDDVAVGSQFIEIANPDKGLRIDFGDFTFHDNGGASSNNGFTIESHTTVNGFRFTIDQVSNGTTADVQLKTYNANEGAANQTITTHNFADDPLVPITEVRIYNNLGTLVGTATGDATFGSITVDFITTGADAGTVTIQGLLAQYSVVTKTMTGYDRIEVLNIGTSGHNSTDGKFSLSELQVETVQLGNPVNLEFDLKLTDADGDSMVVPDALNVTLEPLALSGNDGVTGTASANALFGGGGNDTLSGLGGDDVLVGGSGNDILDGGANNDLLIGGGGDDMLTGGTGVDTFKWERHDSGTGTPATDTVSDFNQDPGDKLNLKELLQGEHDGTGVDSNNLTAFLHFTLSGGNTTIEVHSQGTSAVDQKIVLQGVDLVTNPLGGSFTDSEIIQNLLTAGKLQTDV
jgi:VCBS repeat-containing protein